MTPLFALWLPILLSSVAVFVVSSLIHMMSPWHKDDYPGVPDEDAFGNAIRPLSIPPGDYMVPRPLKRNDMNTPEFKEKVNRGPNVMMTVIGNGPRPMGRYLGGWFAYVLVVTLFAAYVAGSILPAGAGYGIHKYIATTAFTGYVLALWQMSIWYHRKWSTTLKATLDGLIYAVVTALIFGWLWPR